MGGACPSASTYLKSDATTTTLSALGVTSCYYVAANGSDSNDGLSEASGHPWLHGPQMPNCSGNCATLQNTGGGIPPGTGIIMRGGDTWHAGNSGATPYMGGTWGFNTGKGPAGTSANPIYVGVDQAWFTGGSWARPIITWDNAPNASTSLMSCTFPSANTIDFSGGAYYIVDNLELTGTCTDSSNWNATIFSYGSMSGYINIYNMYIHGWSHVGFSNPNNCTMLSTCMSGYRGGVISNGPPYDTLLYDVLDGADSDPVPMEGCFCGAWRIAYSYFNNLGQFITRGQNSFHDSAILNFVDNGHANVMESAAPDIPGASNAYGIYNNVFGHLYVSSSVTSNVGFWPARPVGSNLYWFNNISYDMGPMEFFNVGLNGQDEGTLTLFNNTLQFNHRGSGVDNFSCSATANLAPYVNGNNHFISDDVGGTVAGMYASNCSGQGTDTSSQVMTNSTATSDGYTSSQTFVFSPTSSGSPTVGGGSNRTATFCAAINTAASTDTYLADAYSACIHDTKYACVYNGTAHTISCPGRTSVTRPSSTAWDQGAYEFSGIVTSVQNVTGVTNTQAVLRIRTAQAASTCIIAATETVSGDTPHDIDTSLFASSNVGNRSSSVVNGQDIAFVLGTRGPAFQALDGQWYSRALAAATAYSGTVTCNSDPAVAFSFTTQTIPVGISFNEGNYFNASAFGNYALPTFHMDNLNTTYIDPQTGMKFKLLTGPGQATLQKNTMTGASGTTTNPGSVAQSVLASTNWTNPTNIFTTGGSFASYTNSAQDILMFRLYSTEGGNGVFTCSWEGAIAGNQCGFAIDGYSLGIQGNGGGSTIQVDVALSWNGVSQGTEWQTLTLPASTGTVTYPASGLGTVASWQGANFPLIPGVYWHTVEQHYTVTRVGTAVTNNNPPSVGNGYSSACFALDSRVLTSGSKITINAVEYTVASVDACDKMTLMSGAGTDTSVNAYTSNLSVLIRKHAATSGTINVNSAQVQAGWSYNFFNGGTGDYDYCSPVTTTNATGKIINVCSFPSTVSPGALYAVNLTDQTANILSTSYVPASSIGVMADEYNAANFNSASIWSATDPNSFYVSATLVATGGVTLVKGTYGYNGTTCNYQVQASTYSGFFTNPCVTYTEVTRPSLGKGITAQLTAPSLTSGKFPQPILSFIQDNKAILTAQNNQNTEAWFITIDLTTGLVLGQFSSYMNTGNNSCRFCPLHGALAANATDTYYYAVLENIDPGGGGTGAGPYEMVSLTNLTTTPGISVATCKTTIGTTATTTATWAVNSTTITVLSNTGISNGNYIIAAGIPPTATVTNVSGTTITLSLATQASGSGASIVFSASAVYWMLQYSAGCDNVTFNATDNIPCDPDPSTWESMNMPACTGQSQPTWTQFEGGAYQVGDWMWDVTQGQFFDLMVLGKLNSGSTWTTLRAVNLPQGYSMQPSPSAIMPTSHASGNTWQMICSFQIASIIPTAEVNGSGQIWDRKLYAFGHGSLRSPGIITAEFFSDTQTYGASNRTGSYPDSANLPQTNRVDSNAPFAGAIGVGFGSYVQSHLAYNSATPNTYVDQAPLAPQQGGNLYLWTQSGATNVTGCLWKIPVANAVDPPQKRFLPQMWWTGSYALQDVSGTGTINGDCSYKACSIDYSGDTCGQSGQSVGDVYINAPGITNDTTTGRMYDWNSLNSAPAGVETLGVIQYYQNLLQPNGPLGIGQSERRLTTGSAKYNGQNSYANAKTLPGAPGTIIFECGSPNLQMINALCIGNMPADPGISSIPGNTFMPKSISLPGVSGMTARVDFWYYENTLTGGFCTSRQEHCYTANSPSTYAWAGETQSYTSCSSACTLQIPAIKGKVVYYAVHRKFGGADIVDPTQVAVIN